jgi:hypothetical protein
MEELERSGFEIKKQACGYTIIKADRVYLILDKFYGYDLIPPEGEECKAFRSIDEIVEYLKTKQ